MPRNTSYSSWPKMCSLLLTPFSLQHHLIYVSQDVVETCGPRLENITRISYNLSSTFSRAPAGERMELLLSRGREGYRPGWPMGARGSGQHRPSAAAHGDLALRWKEEAKKFLLRARKGFGARTLPTATLPQLAVVFGFPVALPGARRALLSGLRKRGLPASARGARARGLAPTSTPGWKLVPDSAHRLRRPGPSEKLPGTTMGAPRLRALAAALGLLLCGVQGTQGPAKGGGLEALGPPSGVGAGTSVRLRVAASGTSWTAVASGWRAFEPLPSWIASAVSILPTGGGTAWVSGTAG